MSITYRNTVNTGIHGPSTGQDPIESCFPRANAFWAGLQPFGNIAGIQDMQGTIDNHKWRAADWLVTAIGGAGTTLTPAATHPETATFVTRATADNDGYNIQWSMDGGTTTSNIFVPTAGQMILCYGRFKLDNASTDAHTKGRFHFGLTEDDTGVHASDEDTIEFYKASGAATMVGRVAADGTATDTAALAASLADNTYISLGFRVNGTSSVEFWQGTTASDMVLRLSLTTGLPDENMGLFFEGQTSEAAAVTFHLQHLVAFQEAI